MPPFHVAGKGIDVELAQALADALGVKLSLLPLNADENMADDLRNMVWRGHYLGDGPADVLMPVPVDRPLMDADPQVSIFAPCYRERIVFAIDAMPSARAPRDGWGTGLAVKGDAVDPAQALRAAMSQPGESGRLKDLFARQNVAWRAA